MTEHWIRPNHVNIFRDECMLKIYRAKLDAVPARAAKAHFNEELQNIFKATAIPGPAMLLDMQLTTQIHRWRQSNAKLEQWMRDVAHTLAEELLSNYMKQPLLGQPASQLDAGCPPPLWCFETVSKSLRLAIARAQATGQDDASPPTLSQMPLANSSTQVSRAPESLHHLPRDLRTNEALSHAPSQPPPALIKLGEMEFSLDAGNSSQMWESLFAATKPSYKVISKTASTNPRQVGQPYKLSRVDRSTFGLPHPPMLIVPASGVLFSNIVEGKRNAAQQEKWHTGEGSANEFCLMATHSTIEQSRVSTPREAPSAPAMKPTAPCWYPESRTVPSFGTHPPSAPMGFAPVTMDCLHRPAATTDMEKDSDVELERRGSGSERQSGVQNGSPRFMPNLRRTTTGILMRTPSVTFWKVLLVSGHRRSVSVPRDRAASLNEALKDTAHCEMRKNDSNVRARSRHCSSSMNPIT